MPDQISQNYSPSNKPCLTEEKFDLEKYLRQNIRVYMREYYMEYGKNEELDIQSKSINAVDLITERFFSYTKAFQAEAKTKDKLKQLKDPLLQYIRTLRKELEEREGISMQDSAVLFSTFFTKNNLHEATINIDFLQEIKSISSTIKTHLRTIFMEKNNKGKENISQIIETKASEISGVSENNLTSFELKAIINQSQIQEYNTSRNIVELKNSYKELAINIRSYAKKSNNNELTKLARAYIQNILKFGKDGEIDIDALTISMKNNQHWRNELIAFKKIIFTQSENK